MRRIDLRMGIGRYRIHWILPKHRRERAVSAVLSVFKSMRKRQLLRKDIAFFPEKTNICPKYRHLRKNTPNTGGFIGYVELCIGACQ